MRMKIYQMLVNRHPGISQRYHKVHDNAGRLGRLFSWVYLLWLNFAYYVLFCKWLGKPLQGDFYEEKNLEPGKRESDREVKTPKALAEELAGFDVVSFDIFDTLLFRPFSAPTDLFHLMGQEFEMMDFSRIRTEAEITVRVKRYKKEKNYEVTLEEIWQRMEEVTGIPKEVGMEKECAYEMDLCYANPYMHQVYKLLKQKNKKIVFTSDMYLPSAFLLDMLEKNGYEREQLFLSCEVGKNKGSGELFRHVKETLGKEKTYAHVGDNLGSDIGKAKEQGFTAFHTLNPNQYSVLFRAHDMSPVIGGAYRGIVNNRIYGGLEKYSLNYEFGLIYGGLFAVGYCRFIHEYCKEHGVDRILFLARDGEIIRKVYSVLYPEEQTEYVLLSRVAAAKLSADYMKYDFLRKFVRHKVNQGKSLKKIIHSMELDALEGSLSEAGLTADQLLTTDNVEEVCGFLHSHWQQVLDIYAPQREAAGIYYKEKLGDSKKALAVDIGWAGSGALALRKLVRDEWKIPCEIIGMVAGTNTCHNAEPDMSETFLLDGTLVSYLYSSQENRDLWKKHNPASGYNLYWELITSSAAPSFKGFYPGKEEPVELRFLEKEKNPEGICRIQQGVLDFAADYKAHFEKYPYLFKISGRDAYAPMLVAAGRHEAYLKKVYRDFELKVEVGE